MPKKLNKVTLDKNSVIIAVKPFGDEKFICGIDRNYKADTEQKQTCYAVALGLCQIALDDPDMVYDIGLSVMKIEEMENGKANIININDWRKKLN
jgi:hypothetical protein